MVWCSCDSPGRKELFLSAVVVEEEERKEDRAVSSFSFAYLTSNSKRRTEQDRRPYIVPQLEVVVFLYSDMFTSLLSTLPLFPGHLPDLSTGHWHPPFPVFFVSFLFTTIKFIVFSFFSMIYFFFNTICFFFSHVQ